MFRIWFFSGFFGSSFALRRTSRGPWNEGRSPEFGEEWIYVKDPGRQVRETDGLTQLEPSVDRMRSTARNCPPPLAQIGALGTPPALEPYPLVFCPPSLLRPLHERAFFCARRFWRKGR